MSRDSKKIYPLSSIKNKAGKIAIKPSFTLSLAATPNNIKMLNPPADSNRKKLNLNPSSNPKAPKISKIAVKAPNFPKPKRINSFFIFEEVK